MSAASVEKTDIVASSIASSFIKAGSLREAVKIKNRRQTPAINILCTNVERPLTKQSWMNGCCEQKKQTTQLSLLCPIMLCAGLISVSSLLSYHPNCNYFFLLEFVMSVHFMVIDADGCHLNSKLFFGLFFAVCHQV